MPKVFHSNINCSSCVRTVTPALNELAGENQWFVDTTASDKVLTILSETADVEQLTETLSNLGFQVIPIE